MRTVLYVDDIRIPKVWKEDVVKVTIARTYDETIELLKNYKYDIIDLDHDLGEEKTGYDVAKFIVEEQINIPTVYVHTANPVGRMNIIDLMKHYTKSDIKFYI